jgi:hypothetical protein
MESIVSEVNRSHARPEKSCGRGRISTTRLGWHMLGTELDDNEGARAKECLIVEMRTELRGDLP